MYVLFCMYVCQILSPRLLWGGFGVSKGWPPILSYKRKQIPLRTISGSVIITTIRHWIVVMLVWGTIEGSQILANLVLSVNGIYIFETYSDGYIFRFIDFGVSWLNFLSITIFSSDEVLLNKCQMMSVRPSVRPSVHPAVAGFLACCLWSWIIIFQDIFT